MPVALHLAAAAQSDVGSVRHANQDAWSYSVEAGVFVVCDGMGGAAGGEIASRTAAEALLEHLSPLLPSHRNARAIAQAVCGANRRVHTRAAHEPALQGMGTTLVALVCREGGSIAVVHVGDSRCYRLRRGTLARLTDDHSLIAEQLRMGVLTEEQAAASPIRNVITRAVGTRRSVAPEVQLLETEPEDLYLLCSDGLTRELPDAAIEILLRRPAPTLEARNATLVAAALAAGGRDNVTSMLVLLP